MRHYYPGSNIKNEREKLTPFENAEEVHSHVLLYILNIIRKPGKNEFISYHNHRKIFMGVDLDRAEFTSGLIHEQPTFCTGCTIGEETLNILKLAGDNYLEFSKELQETVKTFGGFYLSTKQLTVLKDRINFVQNCFISCINDSKDIIIPPSEWRISADN